MTKLIDLTRLMDPAYRELLPAPVQGLRMVIAPDIEHGSPAGIGRDAMMSLFGCTADDLPDGEGWGEDTITSMNTHCGTHLDAPLHSGRTIEGRPARTLSDIDLTELFRPGVVLDVRERARPGESIQIAALADAIAATGRTIQQGDAVLIRTGQERYEMTDLDYYNYPGMSGDGTRYLTSLGATILGTDAMGWDRPFPVMKQTFEQTGDPSEIWDGHFAIRDREALIVQQLTNLGLLPPSGFTFGVFPLRLPNTSASPARAVAFVDGQES